VTQKNRLFLYLSFSHVQPDIRYRYASFEFCQINLE